MIGLTERLPVVVAAGAALTVLAGCESSQDQAAKLTASSTTVQAKAPAEAKRSAGGGTLKVVSASLIQGAHGDAIAVQLVNEGSQNQTLAPISVKVADANGTSVYSNHGSGFASSLKQVPNVPPGGAAWWVASGVRVPAAGKSVKASVTTSQSKHSGVSLDVSDLRVGPDPHGGIDALGQVVSKSRASLANVIVASVATKGDRAIAAGSASIGSVPSRGRKNFRIKLVGDPSGGVLVATAASPGAGG
jgi:hypothetical protein